MLRQRPWMRLKLAASLDGKTALPNGASQWITGPEARADGHAWRARACAVLTGIGTVLQDRPRLDVRGIDTPRQPQLVVVDSRLETPLDSPIFGPQRPVLIYAAQHDAGRFAALTAQGATVVLRPGQHADGRPTGKVDLAAMLRDLAAREINTVHLEAGHKLNGSFQRERLVDEWLLYVAPKLLGQGAGMAEFGPLAALDEATPVQWHSVERVGPDLRIRALLDGRDRF